MLTGVDTLGGQAGDKLQTRRRPMVSLSLDLDGPNITGVVDIIDGGIIKWLSIERKLLAV